MPSISRAELAEKLRSISGTSHIAFTATTVPRLTGGKKCPLHGTVKTVRVNGPIGTNFKADVERRQAKESLPVGFEPLESYADYIGGLVEHKGKHYLRVRIDSIIAEEYRLGGKEISKEEVDQYTRKDRENKQGLSNPSEMRRYSLDNITQVSMSGDTFELEG